MLISSKVTEKLWEKKDKRFYMQPEQPTNETDNKFKNDIVIY